MKLRYEESLRRTEIEWLETLHSPSRRSVVGEPFTVRRGTSPVVEFAVPAQHDVTVRFRAAAVPSEDGQDVVIGDIRCDASPWRYGERSGLARVIDAEVAAERAKGAAMIAELRLSAMTEANRAMRAFVPDSPTWDVVW